MEKQPSNKELKLSVDEVLDKEKKRIDKFVEHKLKSKADEL